MIYDDHRMAFIRARVQQLVAQGMTPEQANAQAQSDWMNSTQQREAAAMHPDRQSRTSGAPAADIGVDPVLGQPTNSERQARIDSANQVRRDAEAAEAERVSGLRQAGYGERRLPGPRTVDGAPVRRGEPFADVEDAAGYYERPENPLSWNGSPVMSGFDRDMNARGMGAVFAPDGTVEYRPLAGEHGEAFPTIDAEPRSRGTPGAIGRKGYRKDLAEDTYTWKDEGGNEVGGNTFETRVMKGPTGDQLVYVPTDAWRKKQSDMKEPQRISRMASAVGMTSEEFVQRYPTKEAQTAALRDSRMLDNKDRMDRWKTASRRSGGNPTRDQFAVQNQLMDLGGPGMNDWQNAALATRLANGLDGTTPLSVNAVGAQNAMRFLQGGNLGANGLHNPFVEAQQQQMARAAAVARGQELRQAELGMFGRNLTPRQVQIIRNRVESEFPGMGDAVVAGFPESVPMEPARPVRAARPTTSGGAPMGR